MIIKNIIIILVFIKIIKCVNIDIVSYESISLIYRTNIINKDDKNLFNFLIDTGSPYTWIPGIKSSRHNYYNNEKNNKTPILNNISIIYNGGDNINFSIYESNVFINNILINNISLGITNYESDKISFSYRLFDGILGLGGFIGDETIINYFIKNIITYQMFNQNIIKHNLFSLYINNTNSKYGDLNMKGGEISFGKIDNSKYNGDIKWYDIYNENNVYHFWSLNLSNIIINETLNINNKVLIDSGTNSIVFNKDICDKIHKQIGGLYNETINLYIFKDDKKLKNISIYLNNNEFILNPKDYTYILNNTIYSKIIINNNNNIVLGLPFLQVYYSVYDFENKKIGLAKNI